jgi:hypothetical protein
MISALWSQLSPPPTGRWSGWAHSQALRVLCFTQGPTKSPSPSLLLLPSVSLQNGHKFRLGRQHQHRLLSRRFVAASAQTPPATLHARGRRHLPSSACATPSLHLSCNPYPLCPADLFQFRRSWMHALHFTGAANPSVNCGYISSAIEPNWDFVINLKTWVCTHP